MRGSRMLRSAPVVGGRLRRGDLGRGRGADEPGEGAGQRRAGVRRPRSPRRARGRGRRARAAPGARRPGRARRAAGRARRPGPRRRRGWRGRTTVKAERRRAPRPPPRPPRAPRQIQTRRSSALGSSVARPASREDHVGQQPAQEEAAPLDPRRGAGCGGAGRPKDEASAADQPVDRRALLGGGGQVEAAQPGALLVAALAEDGVDEQSAAAPRGSRPGRGSGRSRRGSSSSSSASMRGAGRRLEPARPAPPSSRATAAPSARSPGAKVAPQTCSRSAVDELAEARLEALDQVGLGEQQIDRQADLEPVCRARRGACGSRGRGRGSRRRPRRGCRPGRATMTPFSARRPRCFFSRSRKPSHSAASTSGCALLQHVAAGGVDQHRVLGEEPVAVAGAADALQVVGQVEREARGRTGAAPWSCRRRAGR